MSDLQTSILLWCGDGSEPVLRELNARGARAVRAEAQARYWLYRAASLDMTVRICNAEIEHGCDGYHGYEAVRLFNEVRDRCEARAKRYEWAVKS